MSRVAQHQSARQYAPAMLWLVLLFALIAGLTLKLYWDSEERKIQLHRDSVIKASLRQHVSLEQRLKAPSVRGASPSQIQSFLGAANPLAGSEWKHGQTQTLHWDDPSSGSRCYLHFDKTNGYIKADVIWYPPNVPSVSSYSGDTQDEVRRVGLFLAPEIGNFHWPLAYVPWVVLYIEYRRRPRRRGIFAFLLVAWTSLTVLLWLIGSDRLLSIDGLLDHEPNFWGVIMLVTTWVVLTYGGFRNRYVDLHACKQCGYSLKGNTSGACPECGGAVDLKQLSVTDKTVV